jgi:acyl-CoA-binding protein
VILTPVLLPISLPQQKRTNRFDAWKANEGMSKEDAMEKYAALVESLKQ